MREIKFRVYDNLKKKMITESVEWNIGMILENKNDFELMQFTGLYDNTKWEDLTQYEQQLFRISLGTEFGNVAKKSWKGRRIYEGDILSFLFTDLEVDKIDENYIKTRVVFEEGRFLMKDNCDFKYDFDEDTEIIGNIHENPELLEEKSI